jgi:hypothetical protein
MARQKHMVSLEEVLSAIEMAKEKVIADEVHSMTKMGVPKAMAYEMVVARFGQKVSSSELDSYEDAFDTGVADWSEL